MFKNKRIFILGMARSGYEAAKLLAPDNTILITDKKEQELSKVKELEQLGVVVKIMDDPINLLDDTYDYVIKNPGIKIDHPIVVKAEELKIPVINEVEVAYHFLPKVKIVGITGSNGKTTTTTLTYEILKKANLPVHLGGNIGYPLCSLVNRCKDGDILVLEISGHQLHDCKNFKTDIGVMTNLSEVHIDHFGSYDNYKYNKSLIFRNHTSNDIAILNADNYDVLGVTKDIKSKKYYFSSKKENDACIIDDNIYIHKEKIINIQDIKIKGMHNYENIMCALLVAKEFDVSNDIIKEVLSNFNGVEHRLEFVKNVNGRDFYNDSKATNVKSTQIALNTFQNPTILLLGGLDRGHSFEGLKEYLKNTKAIVCYGETKERIKEFANSVGIECYIVGNVVEATKKAYEVSNEGDTILLSPACASWDQFACFEDRGNLFKETVNSLC
ncbi:MAG: UDP-N-acetylmuramoyl-L-alanine--D-glutamate ligase [Bacilli bacterium]|nr:UDP-N-acetylmuramoyl-L-alanine--D-glutamate ligase [Bacilli bacterium]